MFAATCLLLVPPYVDIPDIIAGGPKIAPRGEQPTRPRKAIEDLLETDKNVYAKKKKNLFEGFEVSGTYIQSGFFVSGIARRK